MLMEAEILIVTNVAKLVSILYSNVDEERVFSLVHKNKTAFCANISLETSLPSILHGKVNVLQSHKMF